VKKIKKKKTKTYFGKQIKRKKGEFRAGLYPLGIESRNITPHAKKKEKRRVSLKAASISNEAKFGLFR
jgi:hypothetical protein